MEAIVIPFGTNPTFIPLDYYPTSRESKFFELYAPLEVTLSNGDVIVIPKGFKTDLSSTPRWLWSFLPPYGVDLIAYIIHDYLFVTKIYSRKFTDKEMYLWAKILRKDNTDPWLRYQGVRLFGWAVWYKIIKL